VRSVICKLSETEPGTTTVTLERGAMTLVVKGVPARPRRPGGASRRAGGCAAIRSLGAPPHVSSELSSQGAQESVGNIITCINRRLPSQPPIRPYTFDTLKLVEPGSA
jgi:hypothetical protein